MALKLVLLVSILHNWLISDFVYLLLKLGLVELPLNNRVQDKRKISGNLRLKICEIDSGIDEVKWALFDILVHIFGDHKIMLVHSFLSRIDVVKLVCDVMSKDAIARVALQFEFGLCFLG